MIFRPFGRRRSRNRLWPLLSRVFYINPQKQYLLIILSAIAMATLVFSGLLLFRQTDHGDLLHRGQWYMKQGKVALAVKEFERLVRQHKNSYDGRLELGKAYMEIGEPEKAAREFRFASRLKAGNLKESGAHVAISRMMIAQGKYEDAEKQLFQAFKARPKNRKDPELLSALVDLYEDWGDSFLEMTPPDYEKAFIRYSAGLRYVRTAQQQKPLQEKLVNTSKHLADYYDNNKEYDKAIAVLKRALHYEYTADNAVAVGAMYEQKEDLDKAIYWYRKAYEINPKIISLKLSGLLIRKGKELNEAHQPKEAEKYFNEAKKINETVKLPLDTLYPVEASQVEIAYKINSDSFDLLPEARFVLKNTGSYPISYLSVKVLFLTGDNKLAEAQKVVVSGASPLAPQGAPKSEKQISLNSGYSAIPIEDLDKGKLQVRIMVAYTDDKNAKWYVVKNAETIVPEAQKIEDVQRT